MALPTPLRDHHQDNARPLALYVLLVLLASSHRVLGMTELAVPRIPFGGPVASQTSGLPNALSEKEGSATCADASGRWTFPSGTGTIDLVQSGCTLSGLYSIPGCRTCSGACTCQEAMVVSGSVDGSAVTISHAGPWISCGTCTVQCTTTAIYQLTISGNAMSGTYTVPFCDGKLQTSQVSLTRQSQGTCSLDCSATVPSSGTTTASLSFLATSTGTACAGSPSYFWDFGDGGTASGATANHKYALGGTYTWTLRVTRDGATCTRSGTIAISSRCSLTCVGLGADTGTTTSPAGFSFQANSTNCGGSTTQVMDFGDGQTAPYARSHTYTLPGTYTWTYTATQEDGRCSRSGKIVVSLGKPTAAFTFTPRMPTLGESVRFQDDSYYGGETGGVIGNDYCNATVSPDHSADPPSGTTWTWDFGDGKSSTERNPSYVYTKAGTFSPKLTVKNPGGTSSRQESVIDLAENCLRDGTVTTNEGDLLHASDGLILLRQKDCASRTDWATILQIDQPTRPDPVGVYASTVYRTEVSRSDDNLFCGIVKGQRTGVEILDIRSPAQPSLLSSLSYPGEDFGQSMALLGKVLVLLTETYSAQNHTKTIAIRCVDVSDPQSPREQGKIDAITYSADSSAHIPLFLATLETEGSRVYIPYYKYYGYGTPTSSIDIWDIQNPSSPTKVGAYDLGGAYPSDILIAGQNCFVAESSRLEVISVVEPGSPKRIAVLSLPSPRRLALVGQALFVACGSYGMAAVDIHDPAKPQILGWIGGWFDNLRASGSWLYATGRTYPLPGESKLPLTIFEGAGCAIKADPGCSLECTASAPTSAVAGTSVAFSSTAAPTSCLGSPEYAWRFGDGSTSQKATPTHSYKAAGSYQWTVTVSVSGRSCVRSGTIVVSAPPIEVDFSFTPTAPIAMDPVQFKGESSGSPVSWSWSFGLPDWGSQSRSPKATFPAAGQYEVTLAVTDTAGKTGSKTKLVRVNPAPTTSVPVLFVNGFCSDEGAWKSMLANLAGLDKQRWGRDVVALAFTGTQVIQRDRKPFTHSGLYTLAFRNNYVAEKDAYDSTKVNDLDIRELANQLKNVVAEIAAGTKSRHVDIVSHSMGGLVARTYVEGLAALNAASPSVEYAGDIRRIITIDSPHAGSFLADVGDKWAEVGRVCYAEGSTQKNQLKPGPDNTFLTTLNSKSIPESVFVTAVAARTNLADSDGVVSFESQNLGLIYPCPAPNIDAVPWTFRWDESPLLHIYVPDSAKAAALVNSVLPPERLTRFCLDLSSRSEVALPESVSIPTPSAVTLALTFSGTPPLSRYSPTAPCSVDVIARSLDGQERTRRTVPADGYQEVDLGVLPSGQSTLHLVSTCSFSVSARVMTTQAQLINSQGRVAVRVSYRNQYTGERGFARPIPQDDRFGFFYFSNPENPEVFVKVLDFGSTSPFLLFYAGLTDFEYTVTFQNLETGKSVSFTKPAGSFVGGANTTDLPHSVAHAVLWSADGAAWGEVPTDCPIDEAGSRAATIPLSDGLPDEAFMRAAGFSRVRTVTMPTAANELLLSKGRVAVSVDWKSQYSGQTGQAVPLPQKDEFGFFYFTDKGNPEVFVKVLDFGETSPYLLFFAGLTDYEYTVTFRNIRTGQTVAFKKNPGSFNGGADNSSLKH